MSAASIQRVTVGKLDELEDPGCREFRIGEGNWPFCGFVVRQGDSVHAYQNVCRHAGHALNFKPDSFLTRDNDRIICASHGALYEIHTGICVAGPCLGKSLRRVRVEIVDGAIVVEGPSQRR